MTMTDEQHEWYHDNLEAFVGRQLEPVEERAFWKHLPECRPCREAVEAISRELGWLAMAVRPAPPRPGLTHEIAADLLGARRARRPAAARWPLAAAAVALLAVGWGWQRERQRATALAAALDDATARVAAVQDSASVLRRAAAVMHAKVEMGGMTGALTIFADPATHRWQVVVSGLPPAPAGTRYQFWFIREDGMVRGAELSPRPDAPAIVTLGMPPGNARVLGAALSVEPMDAPPDAPPMGRELAHLMMDPRS